MAELRPYPFASLIRRMFGELEQHDAIFDLPARRFVLGSELDTSVQFHDQVAATPFGPAAGPQTQMAQNLVLSWLAGGRIMELKTVQIMDELEIPRPCIDMETIGFNVEWSQELKLQESLEEYVKGAMLIEMLRASGKIELSDGFERLVFDMSVGYDLKGIRSAPVQAFMAGMRDCSELVERFRQEIPDEFAQYRDLEYPTQLSNTLTLSTFHGCPPEEIEGIIEHLLDDLQLNCIVKLNPMLNGPEEARRLLNDVLGYPEVEIPDTAFENDASWEQAIGFVTRLRDKAAGLGLGFGIKLTNTLICRNHRDFFPNDEKEMYMSGPPLHVLAMNLVRKFRRHFGGHLPISFSAGIDRQNFADAVAIGLVPVTVCSDLLKPNGYGRAQSYFKRLYSRMTKVGAVDVPGYILRAFGNAEGALAQVAGLDDAVRTTYLSALESGDEGTVARDHLNDWVAAARVLNSETYVAQVIADPRYHKAKNSKPPKKVDSTLVLFDCLTCDKCLPVCPNDANFTVAIEPTSLPIVTLTDVDGAIEWTENGVVELAQKHQIANFADFCNECGNCDIFCPEHGGPYRLKPRFFGSLSDWREFATHDGFFLRADGPKTEVFARFDGLDYRAEWGEGRGAFEVGDSSIVFSIDDPKHTVEGRVAGQADFTYFSLVKLLAEAVQGRSDNYVSSAV